MHKKFIVKLLKLAQSTMQEEISHKKHSELSVESAIEHIIDTSEYLFLAAQDQYIDTEEFLLDFIRFTGKYTGDPVSITKLFQLFIENIKRTGVIFNNPAVMFTADPSKENLLTGFFTKWP